MFREPFRTVGYLSSSFFHVSVIIPIGWLPFFLFLSCFGNLSGRLVTLLPFSFRFRSSFRPISYPFSSFFRVSVIIPSDWFPFFLFLSCFGNLSGDLLPFFLFLSCFGHHSGRLVTLLPLSFKFREPFRSVGYPTSPFFRVSVTIPGDWFPYFPFLSCFGHHSDRLVTFLPLSFMFRSPFRAVGYPFSSFFHVSVIIPGD